MSVCRRQERMLERLGAATHEYLSALTNGEQPSDEEHERLAMMAYDYAFHTREMISMEPLDDEVIEF